MVKPNLIIAGTVKGGTTSLFSYLEKHPSICASQVKETCFFLPVRYGKERMPLSDYGKFFTHCDASQKYIMESTPGYLDGEAAVAQDMKESIGCSKIIFVLRNPADRLISFFRYQKAQMNLPKDMGFSEYLRVCKSMPIQERKQQENDAYWGIDGGMYIDYLPAWFDIYGQENIKVCFFDELVINPTQVLGSIAGWLDIESDCFAGANYGIENKTVPYRLGWVHGIAISVNRKLEPFLRRIPWLKKQARSLYYIFNEGDKESSITTKERLIVNHLYLKQNKNLADFLKLKGYEDLPLWLEGKG